MKKVLLLLFFSVIGGSLVAQDISFRHPVEKTMNFGVNVFVGGQFRNLKGLNSILKEEGMPEVNQRFMLIGGGINYIYGNHFFHLKGNAAFNERREDRNSMRASTWGFGAGLNYGYRFYIGPVYAVPYAGISRETLFVEIQDLPANSTSINNQISNRNISKLHTGLLAASLGCRLLIPDDWETMLTGIDFSYQVPLKSYWFNGDFTTINTPEINIGGFKMGIEILLLKGK